MMIGKSILGIDRTRVCLRGNSVISRGSKETELALIAVLEAALSGCHL